MQKLQRYTACPGEHYLFDGDKHGCQKPECQTGQGKSYTYNPLIPRLISLYATPEVATLLQQHQSVEHRVDTMSDIQHSPKWKEIHGPGGLFENDPRAICLDVSSDGFSPFHQTLTLLRVHTLLPKRRYILCTDRLQHHQKADDGTET